MRRRCVFGVCGVGVFVFPWWFIRRYLIVDGCSCLQWGGGLTIWLPISEPDLSTLLQPTDYPLKGGWGRSSNAGVVIFDAARTHLSGVQWLLTASTGLRVDRVTIATRCQQTLCDAFCQRRSMDDVITGLDTPPIFDHQFNDIQDGAALMNSGGGWVRYLLWIFVYSDLLQQKGWLNKKLWEVRNPTNMLFTRFFLFRRAFKVCWFMWSPPGYLQRSEGSL